MISSPCNLSSKYHYCHKPTDIVFNTQLCGHLRTQQSYDPWLMTLYPEEIRLFEVSQLKCVNGKHPFLQTTNKLFTPINFKQSYDDKQIYTLYMSRPDEHCTYGMAPGSRTLMGLVNTTADSHSLSGIMLCSEKFRSAHAMRETSHLY